MSEIRVRLLQPHDDRSRFHSGYRDIDRFFADFADKASYRHHIGTVYVAEENARIVGILNVTPSLIEIEGLPPARRRRLSVYPLPVLRLARLAVAATERGRGIGFELVRVAGFLAHRMADEGHCVGIVVDAKPEAVSFYEKHGFTVMEALEGTLGDRPEPLPMFLPVAGMPKQ